MNAEEIAPGVRAFFDALAKNDKTAGTVALIPLVVQVLCDLHSISEAAKSLAASIAERKL